MGEKELRQEIRALKTEIRRLRKSLKELSQPLSVLLRRRGFRIYKKEPMENLMLPEERFISEYYRSLHKYSFRLFLRDVIKHQQLFALKDVTRYATEETTKEYIDYLLRTGLAEKLNDACRLIKQPIKSFGPTLEWFLSETFKREFSAESTWGIKFKRPEVGGDYDLIAKIDGLILYMEIKSSPPKQIYANEIAAFIERISDLLPEIAIFFMDTELRMKDKIVPIFEDELKKMSPDRVSNLFRLHAGSELPQVGRIEKELFHIENKIFIINAKDSIVNNLEKVLIRYFRRVQ